MFTDERLMNVEAVLGAESPCGFQAGDANLRRYVGNDPAYAVDPLGLEVWFMDKQTTGDEALQLFIQRLAKSQQELDVLRALINDPQFQALWVAIRDAKGFQIELAISPKLQALGASTAGVTTEINPGRPSHAANPLEIANTLLHELLHQGTYLRDTGLKMPIPDNVFDKTNDPNMPDTIPIFASWNKQYLKNERKLSKKALDYLNKQYGSSPGRQTCDDINRPAQEWIAGILANLLKNPQVIKTGAKPTTEMRNVSEWTKYGDAGGIITLPSKP